MKVIAPVRDAAGALPDSFTVELALGEDLRQPGRMRVFKGRGGKDCTTEFRTLERFSGGRPFDRHRAEGASGVKFCVRRMPSAHRPHAPAAGAPRGGAPILNDPFYGVPEIGLRLSDLKRGYKGREDEKPLISRLALHASELTLTHPVTRDPLTLQAPLPHEFEIALKYLRKFAAAKG
jgi:23S rRNA-/tRNA-specific pseudouridylate synthase